MQIAADTHSHIYDTYNLQNYFASAFSNLVKQHSKTGIIFLTQSNKKSPSFEKIVSQLNGLPGFTLSKMEGFAEIIEIASGNKLLLVPGMQIISEEKIEVLALTYADEDLNGMKVRDILSKLNSLNVPLVLPWSPGKWLGKRKIIIKSLVAEYPRFNFMIGDIAIRAACEPPLFKEAKAKSIRILCGSDSLPGKGEESLAGKYYSAFDVPEDFSPGIAQFREMLLKLPNNAGGLRNGLITAIFRWFKQKALSTN